MRALWVEDHALIGDSLEILLQVVMPEVSLDKARDVAMAVALARSVRYELVLLDWWIGTDSGEHAMHELRAVGCHAPFLIVSGDEREVVRDRALATGAAGFLPKTSDPNLLVQAIGSVLQSPPAVWQMKAAKPSPPRPKVEIARVFPELTQRQVDVFSHLVLGMSDKQIARELNVAATTVRTHVRAILELIGVHSRGEAAYEARMRGVGDR
jgi:DNA-binding NarL/FixJ family response regulator